MALSQSGNRTLAVPVHSHLGETGLS